MIQSSKRWGALFVPVFLILIVGTTFAYTPAAVRITLFGHLQPLALVALFLLLAYAVGMKLLRLLGVYRDPAPPSGKGESLEPGHLQRVTSRLRIEPHPKVIDEVLPGEAADIQPTECAVESDWQIVLDRLGLEP